MADRIGRKDSQSDRTESVTRATKPEREATESLEPRPHFATCVAVRSSAAQRHRRIRSDPRWERGALALSSQKDRRGLAKTEALLASDVSIVEIDELRPLILE